MTITLTDDEFAQLLFLLGFATGQAFNDNEPRLAYKFIDLTNKINRGNPNFRPYEIPPEYRPEARLQHVLRRLHDFAHGNIHSPDDLSAENCPECEEILKEKIEDTHG